MNIIDTLTKILGFRPEIIICRGKPVHGALIDVEAIAREGCRGCAYASPTMVEVDLRPVTRQVATTPWTDPLEGTVFEGQPIVDGVVSAPVGVYGPQSIDMLKVVESLATASLLYDVDLRLEVAHHERTAADGTSDEDRVEPRLVLTLRKKGAAS